MRPVLVRCAVFLLFALQLGAETASAIWIDVPFVRQPRDGCGAASISMVMQYWAAQSHAGAGPAADVAAIQHRIYSPRLHGITPAAMERYFEYHGFLTFALSGRWSDLEQQLRKGRPLFVALRPRGQSELHYVVIDGIDPARALVTMNDPAQRKLLTQERAGFEQDWSATHDWMLLAVPKPPQR